MAVLAHGLHVVLFRKQYAWISHSHRWYYSDCLRLITILRHKNNVIVCQIILARSCLNMLNICSFGLLWPWSNKCGLIYMHVDFLGLLRYLFVNPIAPYIWATSWVNLFMPYANNKGADQPVHPRSLFSAFVVRCLDSITLQVVISEISRH